MNHNKTVKWSKLTHFLELEVGKDMWVTGSIKLLISYDTSWVIIWPPVFPTQISCVILDMGCNHQSAVTHMSNGFWWFFRFSQKLSLFQGHSPWLWLWLGPTLMQPAGATSWCNQLVQPAPLPRLPKKTVLGLKSLKALSQELLVFSRNLDSNASRQCQVNCTDRPFQQSAIGRTPHSCLFRSKI